MMSGEYDDEDYKDSKRYDDIRGEVDEETKRYSTYEIRMVNQIRRAKKDGEPIYNLPMATQEYYRKNKAEMDALVAKEIDLLNKTYDKYKPKDEIDEGFKVGDKVTFLGHQL